MLGQGAERAIAELRSGPGKDIWLCGGGVLLRNLLAADLVDTVELGVSPLQLGRSGIPWISLTSPLGDNIRLDLTRNAALPRPSRQVSPALGQAERSDEQRQPRRPSPR